MSFYNFHKLNRTVQRVHNLRAPLTRFRSTNTKTKRSGAKIVTYGVFLTTGSLVGTLAYANYDQQFKIAADSYVPGFSTLAERSAVLWTKEVELAREGWQKVKKVVSPKKSDNIGIKITFDDKPQDKPLVDKPLDKPLVDKPLDKPLDDKPLDKPLDDKPLDKPLDEKPQDKPLDDKPLDKPLDDKPQDKPLVDELVKETDTTLSQDNTKANQSQLDTQPTDDKQQLIDEPIHITVSEPAAVSNEEKSQSDLKETSSSLPGDIVEQPPATTEMEDQTLKDTFEEFLTASNELVSSLKNLAQALDTYNLQVAESEKTQDEDKEIAKGSIEGTKEAVDVARKQLQEAKDKQYKISTKLADEVVAATRGGANELAEQVCKIVADYTRIFQENEKSVEEAENRVTKNKEPSVGPVDDQEMLIVALKSKAEELENKMALIKEEEKQKIEEALKKQMLENEVIMNEKMATLLHKKEKEFNEKLEQMKLELEKIYENKIKEQLLTQSEAHRYHINETLQRQAEELSYEFETEYKEKLEKIQDEHQLNLAAGLAHLKGIHSMIDTVAEASQTSRRERNVRAASDSLVNAILTANNDPSPFTKHNISHEVSALLAAAKDDKFITTVILSLPKEALAEGVSSEAGLKARFEKVRRVCSKVSLVPEEGGGLGTYLLSYLQSLLTIDMFHPKMMDLSHYDPSKMSSLDLLRQAKTRVDRGDLEAAVKLVGQLKGESRRVADDWLKEAVLYLETRQAIMAISQYLAAASVGVLQ